MSTRFPSHFPNSDRPQQSSSKNLTLQQCCWKKAIATTGEKSENCFILLHSFLPVCPSKRNRYVTH